MIEMKDGVLRFKKNRIVTDVLDQKIDLNEIEIRYQNGDYTSEEKYQFLALIGYSLDGWSTIVYQDNVLFKKDENG